MFENMKKLLLLLSVCLMLAVGGCAKQPKAPENYEAAAVKFEQYFNAGQYDSLFGMFSDTLKQALPLESLEAAMKPFRQQIGEIKKLTFERMFDDTALYRADFEAFVLTVTITLDEEDKFSGLYLIPYQPAPEK